jgi:hypothetical protein
MYFYLEIVAPSWIREGLSETFKTREAANRARDRVLWSYPSVRQVTVLQAS